MIIKVYMAHTKQCPHLLSSTDPKQVTCCIGSECMAWRWIDPEERDVVMMSRQQVAQAAGIAVEHAEPEVARFPYGNERRGYCGMAGPPRL